VNPHNILNLDDLVQFLKRTPEEEYERFGAGWFENVRDAVSSSQSEAFLAGKSRMEDLGQDLVRLLYRTNRDVLLATPTTDLPLDLSGLPGICVLSRYYSSEMAEVKGKDGLTRKGPNIPWVLSLCLQFLIRNPNFSGTVSKSSSLVANSVRRS